MSKSTHCGPFQLAARGYALPPFDPNMSFVIKQIKHSKRNIIFENVLRRFRNITNRN